MAEYNLLQIDKYYHDWKKVWEEKQLTSLYIRMEESKKKKEHDSKVSKVRERQKAELEQCAKRLATIDKFNKLFKVLFFKRKGPALEDMKKKFWLIDLSFTP